MVGVTVAEVARIIEEMAPADLAAKWDNPGLQLGDPGRDVDRVLVALDIGAETAGEARKKANTLIVAHHPLFFRPVSSLSRASAIGRLVEDLILARVSVYAAHTNFDVAPGGTAEVLGDLAGLVEPSKLEVEPGLFAARIGRIEAPCTASDFARGIAERITLALQEAQRMWFGAGLPSFEAPPFRLAGDPSRLVQTAAVIPGSAPGALGAAKAAGADIVVTGDVKHHAAIDAAEMGLVVLDVGHHPGEAVAMFSLADHLRDRLGGRGPEVEPSLTLLRGPFRALTGPDSMSESPGAFIVNADGASLGNPGRAGAGAVIKSPDGRTLSRIKAFIGVATNNVAEYSALILGLKEALRLGARQVAVSMDSELVVKQVNGAYKVRSGNLRKLHCEALDLLSKFHSWEVRHVDRAENQEADSLASKAALEGQRPGG